MYRIDKRILVLKDSIRTNIEIGTNILLIVNP